MDWTPNGNLNFIIMDMKNMPDNGRIARKARKSAETEIEAFLNLDGSGKTEVHTGYGIFNHMLTLLAFWAGFDLELRCRGDLDVDAHHSMEDCGLVLGAAFRDALGERRGIRRAASASIPMDEAMASVSIDLSGRSFLVWRNDEILPPLIAGEEKDVWREFYKAFSTEGRFNLHISFLYGKNGHHLLESAAKACGMCLREAIRVEGNDIKSTKGSLDL